MMTLTEFDDLLLQYGPDLNHWPAPYKPIAHRLLATDPAAAALMTEAKALESIVEATLAPAANSAPLAARLQQGLQERGLKDTERQFDLPAGKTGFRLDKLRWRWLFGLGLSAATCGLVLALSVELPLQDDMLLAVVMEGTMR